MRDTPDPLERELAALRPREPSLDLRRRIRGETEPSRLSVGIVFFTLGAATALLIWLLVQFGQTPPALPQPPPALAPITDVESAPTLQAYRRALTRSPEELDALLDRHATSGRADERPISAFTRSDVN